MFQHHISVLTNTINQHSDTALKSWFENYIKCSAPFRGVKMLMVRKCLHEWHKKNIEGVLELEQQLDLAFALLQEEYTEDKLAGTMMLQEILIPKGVMKPKRDAQRLAGLFREGHIYDWNVCDWFCMKVLGELIVQDGKSWARLIHKWNNADNLWQARASLVSFERVSADRDYFSKIESSCKKLIKRDERFVKTAVGWLLREISKYDDKFVKQFIKEHIKHFSVETIRNALKYSSKDEKKHYLALLKSV